MENKTTALILLLISVTALVIEAVIMYRTGLYLDMSGASAIAFYGGAFWMYVNWLKLALLIAMTVFSAKAFLRS